MSHKKNSTCPNPLFLMWLEEWKNDAEKKGMNSKWVYVKAISSIKKYPLPLRSGKECKILENIGDGIAKRLDERLKQYLDDGGDPVYLHEVNKRSKAQSNSKVANTKKCRKVDALPESDNSSNAVCSKSYVCKYRSGPYALILTLFKESKKPSNDSSGMNKEDLMKKAQPLCDKSFTVPDAGSHYTAWSSMGTLIRKGCVVKRSSPALYSITDSGCELAQRLLQGTHGLSDNALDCLRQPVSSVPTQDDSNTTTIHGGRGCLPDQTMPEVNNLLARLRKNGYETAKLGSSMTKLSTAYDEHGVGENINNKENIPLYSTESPNSNMAEGAKNIYNPLAAITTSNMSTSKSAATITISNTSKSKPVAAITMAHTTDKIPKTVPKDLNYHYVTDGDNLTVSKSKALVSIDERLGLCFCIKAKKCDLETSGKYFKLDTTRKSKDGFVYAYLADKDCHEISTPAKLESSLFISSSVSSESIGDSVHGNISDARPSDTEVANSRNTTTAFTSVKRTSGVLRDEKEKKVSKLNPSSEVGVQICSDSNKLACNVENVGLDPLFTLYPGSFDIILCVDTTETSGTGKHKKDLAGKLYTSSIHVDTRKLQLGDFLWIVKERNGEKRELVLDTIIERKRMDDLAGSIIDGRFREQKFRLKGCALKNPIYLVENYGSTEHLPVPEKTLRQAITNTQVIDSFSVKETADIHDSANYLTLLTMQLNHLYSNKILHATTMENIKELKMNKSHECLIQEDVQYLMTFEEFSDETQKNKVLTVSEMFAKQLMQIKGVTTEKAIAITETYPTPLSLVNGYESVTCQSDKEKMLSNVTFGVGKRKVGDIISRQVYILYSKLNIN